MRDSNTSHRFLLVACLAGTLFVNVAYALDPDRPLSKYVLDRWGPERGLASGPVYALAQTSDGYIWIGSEGGLTRFDGMTFEASDPQAHVLGLTADQQGGLWVRLRGLCLLYRGNQNFKDLLSELQPPATGVTAMIQTTMEPLERTFLFATPWNGLKLLRGSSLETLHTAGPLPRSPVISLARSSGGDIWLGTRDHGLVRLRGNAVTTVTAGLPGLTIHSLLAEADGNLLVGTDNGIVRWNGTEIEKDNALLSTRHVQALAMTRDRDGNIWVAAGLRGLMRINSQGTSTLPPRTGDAVNAVMEDREGNIWTGNANGLERLRDSVFATYSTVDGLPASTNGPVYADAQNRTWFAPASGGLYFLRDGKAINVAVPGLGRDIVYSIAGSTEAKNEGDLWLGRQRGGLTHLQKKGGLFVATTYTTADGLAQDNVFAVFVSRDSAVWAGTLSGGVSRLQHGRFTTYRTEDGLASNTISAILESSDGTMWFGTPQGLSSLSGKVWRTYATTEGLPSGNINCLLQDSKQALWAGTSAGLALKTSGRFSVPFGKPVSLHEQILGMAEDQTGSLWITTADHVLRIARERLKHSSSTNPLGSEDFCEYQLADGLQSKEGVRRQRSVVATSSGRVWLPMARGLSVVNTAHLAGRSLPPLVHIQTISADGNSISLERPVHIPAGSHRITLQYTGLSLSMPERTMYKSTLEGVDRSWSEPAGVHQVVYSHLAPGNYRFRVVASNVDGVFNSNESALAFHIEPLLWQRWSIRVAAMTAFGIALVLLLRQRVGRIARQMNVRFEERLSERARIAGELHDTLLQTVQASRMIADNARLDHSEDPVRMREAIDDISTWLAQATTEGRAALQALRAPEARKNDLAVALRRAAEISNVTSTMAFVLTTEGTERDMHPLVRDDVYRIGCEAIRNACLHSEATELNVVLRYARDFTINIKDNGRGIAEEVVAGGKPGHFGLTGMQERAIRIHGRLRVLSRINAGTELELLVPANVIFASRESGKPTLQAKLKSLWKRKDPEND